MKGTFKERWLAVIVLGYVAWVVPYSIRQYTFFVSQLNPEVHNAITLGSIMLVCAILAVLFMRAIGENPGKVGLALCIPWLLICLVCDFGLVAYYRGWEPDFLGYAMTRAWQFTLIPVGCILAGLIYPLVWKPAKSSVAPVQDLPKIWK